MKQIDQFADYLKRKLVSDEIDSRWVICQACPELTDANRCKQCGCFMKMKTKLKAAKCPIGKW